MLKLIKEKKYDCVYTCGPEAMMKKVFDICSRRRIPIQLSLERYLKCGIGICGHCCVDGIGIRMCAEGPVIDGATAKKVTEFGKYKRNAAGKIQAFAKVE